MRITDLHGLFEKNLASQDDNSSRTFACPKKAYLMTLKQACYRLSLARKKAASAKEEITQLNKIIKQLGGHPEEKKRQRRNREIYRQYQEGSSYSAIAHAFKLSPSGVHMICQRFETRAAREEFRKKLLL